MHRRWDLRTVDLSSRRGQRGQALVVLTFMVVVLIIVAGLAIDGGHAWVQQRQTQAAADSIAEAGAVVIAERLAGGQRTGADVIAKMNRARDANLQGGSYVAYYTRGNDGTANIGCLLSSAGDWCFVPSSPGDYSGASPVRAAAIPSGARGVRVVTQREFDTTFIRAVAALPGASRFDTMTAGADASAITGPVQGVCSAADGCGVWPVTFPVQMSTCTPTGGSLLVPGSDLWPIVDLQSRTFGNMAIVPLCNTTGAGSFSFLDLGSGQNLQQAIANPQNAAFNIPTWLHTQTGAVNSVEDELNQYRGQVVLIPLFDGTCRTEPASGDLNDCTDPGVGNNTWYHIPYFAAFFVYEAYANGNDVAECNEAPGRPGVGGGGNVSCIKGWFVRYITQGPVGVGDISPNQPAALGVQLVR